MSFEESVIQSGERGWWPIAAGRLKRIEEVKLLIGQKDQNVLSAEKNFYKSFFSEWSKDHYKLEETDIGDGSTMMDLSQMSDEFMTPEMSVVKTLSVSDQETADKFLEGLEQGQVTETFYEQILATTPEVQSAVCRHISKRITLDGVRLLTGCLILRGDTDQTIDSLLIEQILSPKLLSGDPSIPTDEVIKIALQILPHLEEVVVRSLVVPLLKMSNDSCSLLHVMAPNIFQSEAAELLLMAFINHGCGESLNEQDINGIELLLRHHQIINNDDLLYGLSNLSAKLSNSFSKNPRFGKFLLGLAKKIPSTIPAKVHGALVEAVGLHLTFLKKTIELELKKRTVKY